VIGGISERIRFGKNHEGSIPANRSIGLLFVVCHILEI